MASAPELWHGKARQTHDHAIIQPTKGEHMTFNPDHPVQRSDHKIRKTFTLGPEHVDTIQEVAAHARFGGNESHALRFIIGMYQSWQVSITPEAG
jgi:hypothetical protein